MFRDKLAAFLGRAENLDNLYTADNGKLAALLQTLNTSGGVPEAPKEYYQEVLRALRGGGAMQVPVGKLGRVSAAFMRNLLQEDDASQLLKLLLLTIHERARNSLYRNVLIGCLSCLDIRSEDTDLLVRFIQNNLSMVGDRWEHRIKRFGLLSQPYGEGVMRLLLATPDTKARLSVLTESGVSNFQGLGIDLCIYRQLCDEVYRVAYSADDVPAVMETLDVWKASAVTIDATGSAQFRFSSNDLILGVESLIRPWLEQQPDASIRRAIESVLLDTLEDPRIKQANWSSVDRACVARFKQWMALESFEVFIRVISEVAYVQHWEARKEFWGWYLDENHVTEVWPVVGSQSASHLWAMNNKSTDGYKLKYGELRGAASDQSVLLMRIGDLTIAEWSHNGSVRFWHADNSQAPTLYKNSYSADALRRGSNWEKSHQSGWQTYVDRYTAERTGITRGPSYR